MVKSKLDKAKIDYYVGECMDICAQNRRHALFPNAARGYEGIITAHRKLLEVGASGILIGSMAEDLLAQDRDFEDLNRPDGPKDIDVMVLFGGYLPQKFEAGIDWWIPYRREGKKEITWKNALGIRLDYSVKVKREYCFSRIKKGDRWVPEPGSIIEGVNRCGLYVPAMMNLGDMKRIQYRNCLETVKDLTHDEFVAVLDKAEDEYCKSLEEFSVFSTFSEFKGIRFLDDVFINVIDHRIPKLSKNSRSYYDKLRLDIKFGNMTETLNTLKELGIVEKSAEPDEDKGQTKS